MTADFVLAAVEARLLASGAFEALWHLERMDDGEKALLVARELALSTGEYDAVHTERERVAA